MSAHLFMVSYDGDADWLPWSLASFDTHATDFASRVVVIPEGHEKALRIARRSRWTVRTTPDRTPGHMHQQAIKLLSTRFLGLPKDSKDLVVYVDSDFILKRTSGPRDWCHPDGRPWLICQFWHELPEAIPWREGTEAYGGFSCPMETMRTPYLCFPAESIITLQGHLARYWKKPLMESALEAWKTDHDFYPANRYVGQTRGTPGFSEFNLLGNWTLAKNPQRMSRVLIGHEPMPSTPLDFIRQYWSHRPPSEDEKEHIRACGIKPLV